MPEHLHEWPPLGASFIAAAAVTGIAVGALASRPTDRWLTGLLGLDLVGLVSAYLLTRIIALPPVDPDRESLDATGLLTVAAEAAGILAAFRLSRSRCTPAHTKRR